MKKQFVKKWIAFLLMMLLVVATVGCSGKEDTKEKTQMVKLQRKSL